MKSSRRKFLQIAGLSALGWSICPSLLQASGHGGGEGGHGQGVRWAMAIDTRKLDDKLMEECVHACHSIHNVPKINSKQNIKWIWSAPFEKLFPGQMHKFLKEVPEEHTLALCNHCGNPSCVRVCPTKATFKRPDGIVMMDFHRCIGCRYCMAACPYGSRSFNFADPRRFLKEQNPDFPTRTKGVVEKCTFCAERLDEGKRPACVEAAKGAIYFGDLNDPHSEVRQVLKERYSIRRKPGLGTDPSVYYLI